MIAKGKSNLKIDSDNLLFRPDCNAEYTKEPQCYNCCLSYVYRTVHHLDS